MTSLRKPASSSTQIRWFALIVAVMQSHGLTNLASSDSDFDRVAGLTRYAPA